MTKSIILVKTCYKLLYVPQGVENSFGKVTSWPQLISEFLVAHTCLPHTFLYPSIYMADTSKIYLHIFSIFVIDTPAQNATVSSNDIGIGATAGIIAAIILLLIGFPAIIISAYLIKRRNTISMPHKRFQNEKAGSVRYDTEEPTVSVDNSTNEKH